ncbi:RluA family pseudouridine synthase [Bombilactobacillus folatiphilus]|uniref:Pseudouridine synthase n=1 Tax=Bombilactobacillus folatiphilus TaxID=2923362 RepID=A0ABY4P878_9LACO|nr:RluA family pseudouridine synthase [Bombilactobacillus folatiphilus]UQS81729.1 RluA family pseudouridine synthase [Bombilactobacillus folatiphilus]
MNYHFIKRSLISQNLRQFLCQQGFSKTQLKQLQYHNGHVYVNHKRRYWNYQLRPNDEIIVTLPQEQGSDQILPQQGTLDVLYEDDNYLFVNKPAGIASLPAKGLNSPTMANLVKAYLQNAQLNDVIHLVSRLDRDTSGILTFAKNAYAHHLIDQQFRTQSIAKEYLALLEGNFAKQQGEIKLAIGVDPHNHNLRCVDANGKFAWTKYQVVQQFDNFAQVRVQLITGRTHQIRVHFAALGHPLLGDQAYGGATDLIQRQALHCCRFRFFDPIQDQTLTVKAPLAPDLQMIVSKKLSATE